MTGITYTIGRILLPVLFIVSGVQKFTNVAATAQALADKNIPIPDEVVPYLQGIPKYDALTYLVATLEVVCGIMIMVGLKARWGALILFLLTAAATALFHNFWDMSGQAATDNLVHALKNLSIMGGLLLVFACGSHPHAYGRPLP